MNFCNFRKNGGGEQKILGESGCDKSVDFDNIPSQILVNGILQNYVDKKVYNLENKINNITMILDYQVTNCNNMFKELKNIISIDLSKFDSSKVTSMGCMFYGCASIHSLDVSYLDTSLVTSMIGMFSTSSSLQYINLSNFNTSSVINMYAMFYDCHLLKSLDLSSFNTSKVTDMLNMFYNNTSLQQLNLFNFDTKNVNSYSNMFYNVSKNLIYCMNGTECSNIITNLLSNFNNNICLDKCFPKSQNIIIRNKNLCIENCTKDINNNPFSNICFSPCPKGTHESYINNSICEEDLLLCPNYYNYNHSKCIDYIPEGFYLNDSTYKTIDKCKIKCKNCSLESTINDLCLSCNIKENYFPIFNKSNLEDFIDCFNITPEGYFLDNKNNNYKPCYVSCKRCIKFGDEINNNCIECKDNYTFISFENDTNCYEKCKYYYYIDSDNKYYCTLDKNCPNDYPKLINEKNKCISNCIIDKKYKFEYNNTCYESCPENTNISLENENICEENYPNDLSYGINDYNIFENNEKDYNENEYYEQYENKNNENEKCEDENSENENYENEYKNNEINENEFIENNGDGENEFKENNENEFNENDENNEIEFNENNENEFNEDENNKNNENEFNEDEINENEYNENIEIEYNKIIGNSDNENFENENSEFNNNIEINSNEYIKECNANELFKGLCKINNIVTENKDNFISNIKTELMNGKLDSLLINLTNGKDLLIEDENAVYQITTTGNQNNAKYDNISKINLGECESRLKKYYKINEKEPLLIFKIDFYQEGLLIPTVEYEVYNLKTKEKLNLTICKDIKINILLPTNIEEKDEFKHNSSSEYYNNICYKFTTEKGTDITLNDRKSEFINNNMSLCENNCDYKGYESEIKMAKCECQVKIKIPLISEIVINKEKLMNNLVDIKNIVNLKIMKCYKILFTINGLKNNIGSYILLSIILIIIFLFLIFFTKEHKTLSDMINKISFYKKINVQNNGKKSKNNKNTEINREMRNIKKNHKKIKPKKKNKIKRNENILETKGHDIDFSSSISKIGLNKIKVLNKKENEEKNDINKNNLNDNLSINKNINDNIVIKYNDYELNSLEYEKAIKIDKRTYIQYYFSLLRYKQQIIFTFFTYNDYNSRSIKICTFLFSFSLYFTVNTLFFNDSTMHKIYEDQGKFNFIYQMPQIIYSSLICSVINIIITSLSLSEKIILSLKKYNGRKNEKEIKSIKRTLNYKFSLLFIILLLFLAFFWYYISCFCAIYINTQIHLIKDTLISYGFSQLFPFGLSLLPVIFRIPSLKSQKRNKECLYKFSKIIQLI